MAEATTQQLDLAVPACRTRTEPDTVAVALTLLAVIAANFVAGATTRATVNLMGGVSPFAHEALELQTAFMPYYQWFAYSIPTTLILLYLAPLFRYLRSAGSGAADLQVQRRVISGPLVASGLGFCSWLFGVVFFPAITLLHFGRWSPDLASQ